MRRVDITGNIIDYAENQLEVFAERPFCTVDSLVLSQLSYIYFSALVPDMEDEEKTIKIKELLRAEYFDRMLQDVRDPRSNRSLLSALAASPRFRNIKVGLYCDLLDTCLEKQFAAMTFFLDKKTAYIAFRGTDSTLIGWKEDFNMAFKSPVPSQEEALRYVRMVAKRWPGKLFVGGHSKGGNLAVYSSMMCEPEIQDRIICVYSHDGPGFKDNVFQSMEFQRICDRIDKTLPQSSLIGMLLEHQECYSVVKSSRLGLMQHDPFSWGIEQDHFCILEQLSTSAQCMDRTLNEWIASIADEERERFVDTLYSVLEAGNITTLTQINKDWQKNIPTVLLAAKNLSPEAKIFVLQTLKALAVLAIKNIPLLYRNPDRR